MSFFDNFNILVGILFEPEDLLLLREDIMEITSSLSVGVIKKRIYIITMKVVSASFI